MITDPDGLRARILFALGGMDIDATDLARQIGRGADYVRDFLNGRKKSIKLEDLAKIEKILFLKEGYLANEEQWRGTQADITLKHSLPELLATMAKPPVLVTKDPATGTIGIYAPQFPGLRGEMVVQTDPIDIVQRPWFLRQAKDAYGILIIDDIMSPAYEAGDTVIVNPHLPAMPGRDYLFMSDVKDKSSKVRSRRLLSWDDVSWEVMQFKPEDVYRLSRSEWPRLHRVVGKISV